MRQPDNTEQLWQNATPLRETSRKAGLAPNPDYRPPKLHITEPIHFQGKPIPERKWIVDRWIPAGVVTLMYGEGGTGKSLLAQQLATACAVGKDWIGLPTQRCKTLSIWCEDDETELQRRQERINAMYDIDFADLEDMYWSVRIGQDNLLCDYGLTPSGGRGRLEPTELYNSIYRASHDLGIELVQLDSLHDLYGGNENARPEVRQFGGMLGRLALDIGGGVMVNAHPSRAGRNDGESGSTAWNNFARSRLFFHHPQEDDGSADRDIRWLSRKKANYATKDEKEVLRWVDGAFVNNNPDTGIIGRLEKRSCDRIFLQLLDKISAEGRHVSESNRASNYAPKVFSMRPDREGWGKPDFARAMERLFSEGKIRVSEYGRPGDLRQEIVRCDDPDDSSI